MLQIKYTGDALWARIERSVEKVKQRLQCAARLLDAAGIPYAVIGGNAVQLWVAQVNEAAVRNTQDVDILLNRPDLPGAVRALQAERFIFAEVAGVPMFLDGPGASPRDAVHVIFAEEKVTAIDPEPAPSVEECRRIKDFRTLSLDALVAHETDQFPLQGPRASAGHDFSRHDRRWLARSAFARVAAAIEGTARQSGQLRPDRCQGHRCY